MRAIRSKPKRPETTAPVEIPPLNLAQPHTPSRKCPRVRKKSHKARERLLLAGGFVTLCLKVVRLIEVVLRILR